MESKEISELNHLKTLLSKIKDRTVEALKDDSYNLQHRYDHDAWYGGEQYKKLETFVSELATDEQVDELYFDIVG